MLAVVRIPTILLSLVTIREFHIENATIKKLYQYTRYFIRISFVYIPNILQIIYLSTVDNFEVSLYL